MISTGRYCAMAGVMCMDTDVEGRHHEIVMDFGKGAGKEARLGFEGLSHLLKLKANQLPKSAIESTKGDKRRFRATS